MNIELSDSEAEELFVILKPLEQQLVVQLAGLLARIEKRLYERFTIEEMERLLVQGCRDYGIYFFPPGQFHCYSDSFKCSIA